MMAYKFTNAIVRKPNKSIHNALSSQYLHPSYEKILEIHDNYINSIEEAGLNIILLDSLEQYPDSIFVEDPALIFKNNIIVLNPSDVTRNGEAKIIINEISKYFEKINMLKKFSPQTRRKMIAFRYHWLNVNKSLESFQQTRISIPKKI